MKSIHKMLTGFDKTFPRFPLICSGDTIVLRFNDTKLFKNWILLSEKQKEKIYGPLVKNNIKVLLLPPGMSLVGILKSKRGLCTGRIVRERGFVQQVVYVLSGQRRADRLIGKAVNEYEDNTKA